MINRVEKLCLLSEMIAFAKANASIKTLEYKFLLGVARQLGIVQEDFDYLIEFPVNYGYLKSHSERIIQFHSLIVLMILDQNISLRELVKLQNFGLRMGLGHNSIILVLDLMESFPNKIIPSDFLIAISKLQYN